MISISKAKHLPSFGNRGPGNSEMGHSAIFTDYHSFTGSVTTEDSDAAGQRKEPKGISKETKEKCNTESNTNEEQKAVFSLASDTDSMESVEMHSKSEHDTDSHANEDPSKAVDTTDGLPTQRTQRLSSSDSYFSHQDSKTMPWYASSLDFEMGPDAKLAGSESPQLHLDRINESHLEANLDELHQVNHRTLNKTSTPSREVRFVPGGKGEFDHDMGGRSSPDSSGRGLCFEFTWKYKMIL